METTIGASVAAGQLKLEADADALITAPLAAKDKIDAQYANAVIERDAAKARLAALETSLEPLEVVAANAAAALTTGSAGDVAAKVKVAEAGVEISRLTPFITAANNAGTRASAYFKFYNDFTVDSKARVDGT